MRTTSIGWPDEAQQDPPSDHASDVLRRYRALAGRPELVATVDALLAESETESWCAAFIDAEVLALVEGWEPSEPAREADPRGLTGLMLVEVAARRFLGAPSAHRWKDVEEVLRHTVEGHSILMEVLDPVGGLPPSVIDALTESIDTRIQQLNARERGGEAAARSHTNSLRQILHGQGHPLDGFLDEESPALEILSYVALDAALELLVTVRSSKGVGALIQGGPADPRSSFMTWCRLLEHAPEAFTADGRWNGEILLPTLLRDAGEVLDRSSHRHRSNDDSLQQADSPLLSEIADVVFARADGPACAWRWAAWLLSQAALREGRAVLGHGCSDWSLALCEALVRHDAAREWEGFDAAVLGSSEALPLDLLRALAATQRDATAVGWEVVQRMITEHSEALLEGRTVIGSTGFLAALNASPNSLGPQLLAGTLACGDVVDRFDDLWERATLLGEAVRNARAFQQDQHRNAARNAIWLVAATGTATIGHLRSCAQDEADVLTIDALIGLLHEWLTELLEAEVHQGGPSFHVVHDHLLAHAFLTARHRSDARTGEGPSLPEAMLATRVDVSQAFVDCLTTLAANGVPTEQLDGGLGLMSLNLESFIKEIERHNEADATHPIDPSHLLSQLTPA